MALPLRSVAVLATCSLDVPAVNFSEAVMTTTVQVAVPVSQLKLAQVSVVLLSTVPSALASSDTAGVPLEAHRLGAMDSLMVRAMVCVDWPPPGVWAPVAASTVPMVVTAAVKLAENVASAFRWLTTALADFV